MSKVKAKIKRAISRLLSVSKLNAIVSLIALVTFLSMIVALGVLSAICMTVENACASHKHCKKRCGKHCGCRTTSTHSH